MNNPYEILGIDRNASVDEIKKAYKKLCKEHHPDVNAGSKESEEKFKDIASAYEILSDPQKKQQYDTYGDVDNNGNGFGNMHDMFNSFFRRQPQMRRGSDVQVIVKLTLLEIIKGCRKTVNYVCDTKCSTCDGKGGENVTKCSKCNGTGQINQIVNTPFGQMSSSYSCGCNSGSVISNPCKTCKGQGVSKHNSSVTVDIPAGVANSMHIPYTGAGNEIRDGIRGDLIIIFEEIPDALYKREGDHIISNINISISDAVLGCQKHIKTPNGEFKFFIEAGCESGKTFNFNGKGIPSIHGGVGNLYVKVNVTIPKKITPKMKALFEELKTIEN